MWVCEWMALKKNFGIVPVDPWPGDSGSNLILWGNYKQQ